jgi:hypothetical protein
MPNLSLSEQDLGTQLKEPKRNGSPDSMAEAPDLPTCMALVERIGASSKLKRATRLRELLLFLGRRQLRERCEHLREQEIGIEVFGRAAAYDTNLDNIVRANVSELRKRIDAYFETEGRTETFRMEIPRGSYTLVFRKRAIADPEPAETAVIAAQPDGARALNPENARNSPTPRSISGRLFAVAAGVLVVALSSACASLWMRNRALQRSLDASERAFYPWRYEPTVASFWSAFLDSGLETDVVVPDAALSQYEYYARTSVLLRDYVNRSYLGQLQSRTLSPDLRMALGSFSSLNFVTLSAVKMADNILALDPLKRKMHLYFSREYIPSFVDRDNVILLGDQVSNPFIQLVENRLNFTVDRDGNHLGPVINHAPAPGEQAFYIASDSIGYCVVAYLPNPGHSGKILLIQGSSPAATEAAEFFLLSERQLSAFKKNLRTENFPYFEVLLKTSQVTGTPLTAALQAYRVHFDQ